MKPNTKKTPRKKPLIRQTHIIGHQGMDMDALASIAKSEPTEFFGRVDTLIENGDLGWSDVRSLPRLYNALADIEVPCQLPGIAGNVVNVMSSAFPLLSGALTVAAVNAAYEGVPTIGQDLVTDMEDNKKVTHVAAITTEDTTIEEVKEGDPFPIVGAGEKRFDIRHLRNGRMMEITGETIEENDISGIVDRVNALGEIPAELIEAQTLRRITDHDGSKSSDSEPYVFRPQGVGTKLFSSTVNTPNSQSPLGTRVDNNAFVNETDFENARKRLAAMLNYRGVRIAIPMSDTVVLAPDAVAGRMWQVLNSDMTAGVTNEAGEWGPRGRHRPTLRTTPKMDDLSTTAWYMGNPRKQFRRKWKLRLENMSLGQDTQRYLQARIAFQARVAWDVEIGAIDSVFWVQCLSGTTAPADE